MTDNENTKTLFRAARYRACASRSRAARYRACASRSRAARFSQCCALPGLRYARACASRGFGIAALIAVILSAPAFATTVVRLNMEQLVQRADLIVQGHVESVYSQWDGERRLIFTYISIRVDESLKGERRQSVLIRQVGGTVGTIQMSIAGVPQFKSGETAIVFLKHQDDSTFQVVGMSQGLYKIIENFAVSNVFGVDLFDSKTGEITRPPIGGRAPLEQLKTKIQELMR